MRSNPIISVDFVVNYCRDQPQQLCGFRMISVDNFLLKHPSGAYLEAILIVSDLSFQNQLIHQLHDD